MYLFQIENCSSNNNLNIFYKEKYFVSIYNDNNLICNKFITTSVLKKKKKEKQTPKYSYITVEYLKVGKPFFFYKSQVKECIGIPNFVSSRKFLITWNGFYCLTLSIPI